MAVQASGTALVGMIGAALVGMTVAVRASGMTRILVAVQASGTALVGMIGAALVGIRAGGMTQIGAADLVTETRNHGLQPLR